MENFGDLAIPEIKLIQNTGGDQAKSLGSKPGDFYCEVTGENIPGEKGFDIVVTGPAQKTRTYWGTTEINETPPVCASNDGVTSMNGDLCQTACPYKAFNDAPYMLKIEERRLKCTPNFHITALKLSDMMPILIRCGGISSMAARELNTVLKFHRDMRGGQYYKAKIHVVSVKKKTSYGDSFAIKFGSPQLITDPVMQKDVREGLQALSSASPTLELSEPPEEDLLSLVESLDSGIASNVEPEKSVAPAAKPVEKIIAPKLNITF